MAEPRIDGNRLNEIRGYVLGFSMKLSELRHLLREYVDREGVNVARVVQATGISWGTVLGLIHGNSAVAVEAKVYKLATLVGMDDQDAAEVAALGAKVPYRCMGLLFFDRSVIDTVFDLLVMQNGLAQDCTMASFSKAFVPHDQTVLGACNYNKEAFETLQNSPEVVDAIIEVLLDEERLRMKLKEVKQAQCQEREKMIAEIDRRVQELLPGFDSKVDLVRTLGLSAGSLDHAKLTNASDAQVKRFLLVLQKAIDERGQTQGAKEVVQEILPASLQPAGVVEEAPPDPFNGLAGETTHGVSHVLTADNFRQIEGMSAEAVVEALATSAQFTIGLLALVAQMKSDEIRKLMQLPKNRRVLRALYDALEVSSATDPSPLLAMFDEQRALQWGSLTDVTKKGGAK